MRRLTRCIWLSLGLCTLSVAPGEAAAFWVAPDGDDSAAGTRSQPWRTLGRSFAALEAGDTLQVRGGVYRERLKRLSIRPGTAARPIRVQAAPGERPVLQGLLWLHRPSYWMLDGLNVTWDAATGQPNEHMVKLTNGIGWSFRNAEVWGARSFAAILVAGTSPGEPARWTLSGNHVHDTYRTNRKNRDHLLYVNTGVDAGPGVVERNLLANAPNGSGIKLAGADETEGAANVIVRWNTIIGTVQPILVGGRSRNNLITGNLLEGAGPRYGLIRGYRLTGGGNIARGNAGGGAARMLLNDRGFAGVRDGGDNVFPLEPHLDTLGPRRLWPRNPSARGYGRWAGAHQ
jgi:hypothetical protein